MYMSVLIVGSIR